MYNRVDIYDDLFLHMRPDFPFIWALLEVGKPKKIVEYGAGSGRLLPLYLQTDAKHILGLDLEQKMVDQFKQKYQDQNRIDAYCQDICEKTKYLKDADIVILTSSLMKHIDPNLREQAWRSIFDSISDETLIFVDHASYIYDKTDSTSWQSYYDTLKFWWAEEHRNNLKRFVWKKEVNEKEDILFYKDLLTQEEIKIKTFIYTIEDLLKDIKKVRFDFVEISDKFTMPFALHETKRFIGLLAHRNYGQKSLLNIQKQMRGLLNIEN